MTRNYFRVMSVCVSVSFILLVGATVFKLSPFATMAGGVVPLVYYHIFYLRPQAKTGLSQTAIDSVYYFGFLVTVAALGISAIVIANNEGAENLKTVVYQFGVGLFATGYAVVARMHLSSISTMVDEASPEAILDRYVKRSIELVNNVEMASEQLTAFSTNLMKKTAEVTEVAHTTLEKAMLDAASEFKQEMKATLETARDSLTTIRGLVSDTSFIAEREELTRSLKSTVEAATSLNKALAELALKSREGAQATQQTILTSAGLDENLRKLSSQIDMLGGNDGIFSKSSESVRLASDAFAECNQKMATAVLGLTDVAKVVTDTGPTFKNMRTLTQKAAEQLEGLASASSKLDVAVTNISDAATASDSLAIGMHKMAASLSPLTTNTQSLTTSLVPLTTNANALAISFQSASVGADRLQQELTTLPKQVTALKDIGEEVADSLDQICEIIEEAVAHSKQLSANTSESAKTIDAAGKFVSSADSLEKSISSLRQLFNGLSDSVVTTQTLLSDSSNGIKTSITRSTEALEADVARSSKAVSLLTDKLVQVAQNIIDRTKHPESVG
ncbi:hypothetical protein KTQ42_15670|uniref:hypothetical protein n=1 Tax=Noviherbaspirillum sp. L7-7A TaxID=2850560 RepID=UPI001C2C2289|nr:hypothetical protein [Noviherbaspirillum sp. L7-7A]MBV0880740.1 hypothetical protein [Noviherbaspirillum sp. L7-7A]